MNASNYNISNHLNPESASTGVASAFVDYNANWGVVPRVVTDPQVNAYVEPVTIHEVPSSVRQARRKMMADLAEEFAASHDDLLIELAR